MIYFVHLCIFIVYYSLIIPISPNQYQFANLLPPKFFHSHYWKSDFPISPPASRRSVCHNFLKRQKVTFNEPSCPSFGRSVSRSGGLLVCQNFMSLHVRLSVGQSVGLLVCWSIIISSFTSHAPVGALVYLKADIVQMMQVTNLT